MPYNLNYSHHFFKTDFIQYFYEAKQIKYVTKMLPYILHDFATHAILNTGSKKQTQIQLYTKSIH